MAVQIIHLLKLIESPGCVAIMHCGRKSLVFQRLKFSNRYLGISFTDDRLKTTLKTCSNCIKILTGINPNSEGNTKNKNKNLTLLKGNKK